MPFGLIYRHQLRDWMSGTYHLGLQIIETHRRLLHCWSQCRLTSGKAANLWTLIPEPICHRWELGAVIDYGSKIEGGTLIDEGSIRMGAGY